MAQLGELMVSGEWVVVLVDSNAGVVASMLH